MSAGKASASTDEFGDGDIDDEELVEASFHDLDFDHIDNYANPTDKITRNNTAKNASSKEKSRPKQTAQGCDDVEQEPRRLENGNWACNHPCKDKQACKHLCCKDGMAKPPKKTVSKYVPSNDTGSQAAAKGSNDWERKTQTKLQLTTSKRKSSVAIEELDLSRQEKKKKADFAVNGPKDYRDLHRLHVRIQKKDPPSIVSSVMYQKPKYCYGKSGDPSLSFLSNASDSARPGSMSSDYGDIQFEDLTGDLHQSGRNRKQLTATKSQDDLSLSIDSVPVEQLSEAFGDDESLLENAIVGVTDSKELQATIHGSADRGKASEESFGDGYDFSLEDEDFIMTGGAISTNNPLSDTSLGRPTSPTAGISSMPPRRDPSLYFHNTSSLFLKDGSTCSNPVPKDHTSHALKQAENGLTLPERTSKGSTSQTKRKSDLYNGLDTHQNSENVEPKDEPKEEPVPEAYKDLEPWILKEFGDIVELVD
jgi:ATP-dependent DNA helicase HFM1/MER3